MTNPDTSPLKVAVIGSGITGLSAAWLLSQHPNAFDVKVFEKNDYPGGHTHTVQVPALSKNHASVGVDTGFIVCNPATYPNFLAFMKQLDVQLTASDMSFAVSRDKGAFEWAGDNLASLFAQFKNVYDFSENGVWRMLLDVIRFHHQADLIVRKVDRLLEVEGDVTKVNGVDADALAAYQLYASMTIGDFLEEYSYSKSFLENFLVPQTAAIWSTPAGTCLSEFPILALIRFFRNHRMLQLIGRPQWLTVLNGSKSYVDQILAALPKDSVQLNCPVTSVKRASSLNKGDEFKRNQVALTTAKGQTEKFDYVIFACHGDQALNLLKDPTNEEKKALAGVQYTTNRAVLHRDPNLMPISRSAWSSWNYLTSSHYDESPSSLPSHPVSVTYWMNRLQPFIPTKTHGDIFLTINPLWEPKKELIIDEYSYEHPVYNFDLAQCQELINGIQGTKYSSFAGAWCGYGFHEDGLTAGLLSVLPLKVAPPFPVLLNGGYPTSRTYPSIIPNLPHQYQPSETIYKKNIIASRRLTNRSSTSKNTDLFKAVILKYLGPYTPSMVNMVMKELLEVEEPQFNQIMNPHSSISLLRVHAHLIFETLERILVTWFLFVAGLPLLMVLWGLGKVELTSRKSKGGCGKSKLTNGYTKKRGKVVWNLTEDWEVRWIQYGYPHYRLYMSALYRHHRRHSRKLQSVQDKRLAVLKSVKDQSDPLKRYKEFLFALKEYSVADEDGFADESMKVPNDLLDLAACMIASMITGQDFSKVYFPQTDECYSTSLNSSEDQKSLSFIRQTLRRTGISMSTFLVALVYIDRLKTIQSKQKLKYAKISQIHVNLRDDVPRRSRSRRPSASPTACPSLSSGNDVDSSKWTTISLFLAANITADKYLFDSIYNNSDWASFTQIPLATINHYERQFLSQIKWDLKLQPNTYARFISYIELSLCLKKVYGKHEMTYKELSMLGYSFAPRLLGTVGWSLFRVCFAYMFVVLTFTTGLSWHGFNWGLLKLKTDQLIQAGTVVGAQSDLNHMMAAGAIMLTRNYRNRIHVRSSEYDALLPTLDYGVVNASTLHASKPRSNDTCPVSSRISFPQNRSDTNTDSDSN
ncbi:hypothetical protein BKA69DRAFT_1126548 [Paraphysoderma sedebokerense]|nr:hypothetical protein BKA69DRAFT_1126548 [Paraphysoderma sedebokerense]